MALTQAIEDFTTRTFGSCPWLGVIIIAIIPIIELRGAIPFAMISLPWWESYLCAVLGSTIPALFVLPLLKPIFNWMRKTRGLKGVAETLDDKFVKQSHSIEDTIKNERKQKRIIAKKFVGVMSFVAIPLPLTGAWTGSAIAAYLKMPYWLGVLAVFVGNLISGAIMTTICILVPDSMVGWIMLGFLCLAIVVVTASIVWHFVKKKIEITADEELAAKEKKEKKETQKNS